MELNIHKDGDNLVVVIPEELRSRLDWNSGDILNAEISGEGLTLVRTETAHDRAMKIAREVMVEYHDVFAKLAKS
jgi:bifunctional DNA-binding transcriptional regulator/antitoxin component of YhaV-PrlF toxin-antitoxin module